MDSIKLNNQFFLVKFPIIFPLIYFFILYQFPQLETYLILFTILLLGETHFGATWPFFLDKSNSSFLKENKNKLIYIPVLITVFSFLGFIFFKNFFLLIFFAVNMYHVTRQSFGICKLYGQNPEEINFQAFFIYLTNFLFFLIAFLRFYIPVINEDHLLLTNIFSITLLILISAYFFYKFKFSENYLIFLTGCLIFYPACFVTNPIHIILMGVTMHYTQYLYLTHIVQKSRAENREIKTQVSNKYIYSFALIIITYSILMTLFSSMDKFDNEWLKQLIFIPILGQMLHFYLDSQLWKFSDKHNRDNTLVYLKKIVN